MNFRNLTVEIPGHEALVEQFHTVHLRFDSASAVVSGPVSPDGATEVFRRAKRLVARDCACCRRFPRLGVPARWDDGMRTAVGDSVVALARVIGAVGGDAADLLIRRDLAEQIGQNRCVADMVSCDFNGSDFQCLPVNPEMDLATSEPFCAIGTSDNGEPIWDWSAP